MARQFEARSQKFSSGSSRNLPMEEDIYKDLVYCGLCGSKFTRECVIEAVEYLKRECQAAERVIEKAKKKRMAEFETYALGKADSYDSSMDQMDMLRQKYEELREQLSQAEDKARKYRNVKIHDSFAVMKLTPELMDEYVERVEIHLENEIKAIWK